MKTIVCGRWNRHSSLLPESKNLRAAKARLENEKKSYEEVRSSLEIQKHENELAIFLLRELEEAGVDFIGDGGIRWDSIYDTARRIAGCSGFKSLTRIPNTNHFHRQPIADSSLQHTKPILLGDLEFAKRHTDLPIVMSLPGPYSLTRQTQNLEDIGLESLTKLYAKALNKEIKILLDGGAEIVRIEDPQILAYPENEGFLDEAYNLLLCGIDNSRVALATWFGNVDNVAEYFSLPFGIFFVDLVEGDWHPRELRNFPQQKTLVAGIFDARQTHKETNDELEAKLGYILKHVDRERVMLSPHTDLHFLPHDKALDKVKHMVQFAEACSRKSVFRSVKFDRQEAIIRPNVADIQDKIIKARVKNHLVVAFPTSSVGSFPQFAVRGVRAKFKKKEIDEETYRHAVEEETRKWMDFQDKIGISCPVGGEFLREDMAAYFAELLGARLCDFVPSYENRRYRPAEYFRNISIPENSMTAGDFRFVQSLTERPVKETITGPVTMADWGLISHEGYYCDRLAFRTDFARAIRAEIEQMLKAGVKILQIDEPALTTKMKEFAWDTEALYETIRGYENKLYLILHICYSNLNALDRAFPTVLQLPFHQIHMEVANRGDAMFGLIEKHGFGGKDIGLGVIDVHTDKIETVDNVVDMARKARRYFRPEQIWITPDCGLKERSESVAMAKLQVMCEAAKRCRNKLV